MGEAARIEPPATAVAVPLRGTVFLSQAFLSQALLSQAFLSHVFLSRILSSTASSERCAVRAAPDAGFGDLHV
jgi:hypothetical protein